MTSDLEIREVPPIRQWYERSAINPVTLNAGGTIVKLRDARHEARVEKLRRQLASASRREKTWAPVVVVLAAVASVAGLVGTAIWVIGGLK